MSKFPRLQGPRLYLSPVDPADAEIYTRWLNDPDLLLRLGSYRTLSLASEREFLERMSREPYNFAIVRAGDDRLLGNCSLFEMDPVFRRATCGLFLGDPESRGQGYGTEALALLLIHAFDDLNLQNVMLSVFAFNTPAIRCYQRLGFRTIGTRRQCYFAKGAYHDEVLMDMLREDLRRDLLQTP